MPLISIIVPVYNTEKYLRQCLDSLVNQTFNDIEIIVVNDASKGNCKEIVEEYQDKDNRIRYIEHNENKGTLIARNSGSIAADGNYITYVDSDDELDINTCKEIYKIVSQKDYDIITFSIKVYSKYDVEDLELWVLQERNIIKYPFIELLEGRFYHNVAGNFFKKEIIKKSIPYIPNINLTNSEDLLQYAINIYFCKSYKTLNKKLYIYHYDIGASYKIENLEINKYKFLCQTVKISLDEIYNFLCKLNVEKIYGYSFSKLSYNHYNYLNQVKDKIYQNILNDTFGKDFVEGYESFKDLSDYNRMYYKSLQLINEKLIPYFFSIIIFDKYTNIRIFGIKINIKNKRYYSKPIVITFNNLLKNIFSISANQNGIFLKFVGLRFYIKKRRSYDK